MLKFYYMSKNIKQIYVSMELGDNEIKLLVSEYYNTRFNIIRLERKETSALSNFKVLNRDLLIDDIKELVNDCSSKIQAQIENVILVIPSIGFKRFGIKSKIVPNNSLLNKKDVARALSNALKAQVDKDVMIVNQMINKFNVNGISTRKMPENEPCEQLSIDIDLLCANRDLVYNYVDIVESSGVKVLDIVLNNYAILKEASLFEESLKKNLIVIEINARNTFLSLLNRGRLVSSEIIYDGLYSLVLSVYNKFHMPRKDIMKLIKNNKNYNTDFNNDIVYAWSENNVTKSVSCKDIDETIEEPLDNYVDRLFNICKPLLNENVEVIITGEGQQMIKLIEKFKAKFLCQIKAYNPDTIGVRDPNLAALYGSFFVFREKQLLNDINVDCINLLEYDANIEQKDFDTEGDTITTKIKNIFRQYLEREEH